MLHALVRCTAIAAFLTLLYPIATSAADDSVTAEEVGVQLSDGRQVRGLVDARSDRARLWLRHFREGVQISSGFEWRLVQTVITAHGVQTAEQLQDSLPQIATTGLTFEQIMEAGDPIEAVRLPTRVSAVRRVKSLHLQCDIAQWDRDVQPDGIEVSLYPLDAEGRIVPVRGNVELTLYGEQLEMPSSQLGSRFVELERTARLVSPDDFADGPAVVRLAFSKFHPDFAPHIGPVGLVHARLAVAGQGAFEASHANVCWHPPQPYRDQLQLYTGNRYLKRESGGGPNR